MIQEENLLAARSVPEKAAPPKAVTKKPERHDAPSQQSKPQEDLPTTLQQARGPRADDRLLDLVEKDLDKAVERSTAPRRLEFSKAVIENPKVRYFINYFSRGGKVYFERILARSGKYMPMIARVLREEGLPEELAYLALIESAFSPKAVSPTGAVGLWQFVPVTARKYGLRIDSWLDERRDPVKSTRAAAAYLKDLHDYFGRWYLATAAYNAGQGAIDRALQKSGAKDFWSLAQKARLREETRNFVPKFVAASLIAADPKKYGFSPVDYETPTEYEEVEVEGTYQLASLAQLAGADLETVRDLNPALLRNRIPPGEDSFRVRLPAGHAKIFAQAYKQERENEEARFVTHEVRKGETLFSIARRYGQQVRALIDLNGLTDSRLHIGQKLKVFLQELRGALR
jgi:membrane-bound lytic murein transglycosylase D